MSVSFDTNVEYSPVILDQSLKLNYQGPRLLAQEVFPLHIQCLFFDWPIWKQQIKSRKVLNFVWTEVFKYVLTGSLI